MQQRRNLVRAKPQNCPSLWKKKRIFFFLEVKSSLAPPPNGEGCFRPLRKKRPKDLRMPKSPPSKIPFLQKKTTNKTGGKEREEKGKRKKRKGENELFFWNEKGIWPNIEAPMGRPLKLKKKKILSTPPQNDDSWKNCVWSFLLPPS